MNHQSHISLKKNRELIGRKFRTIIDEFSHGVALGRLYSHAPEIDGVVIVDECGMRNVDNTPSYPPLRLSRFDPSLRPASGGGRGSYVVDSTLREVRNPKFEILNPGDFVTVRITDAYDYDLKGTIVG